jgi:hypothetical protein
MLLPKSLRKRSPAFAGGADVPKTTDYLYRPTPAGCFSSCVSSTVEACANAADSAIPSATRPSFAILPLTNGLRTNREKIAAIPHSTAEM